MVATDAHNVKYSPCQDERSHSRACAIWRGCKYHLQHAAELLRTTVTFRSFRIRIQHLELCPDGHTAFIIQNLRSTERIFGFRSLRLHSA